MDSRTMDSREVDAPAGVVTAPSLKKGHKSSSSLGSLYEVLADLDETQLQYLIQEMNHTGHQNVPVGEAVSAFEAPNPSASLNTLRRSMLPPPPAPASASAPASAPAPAPQRQLSKSQRGKLRLQTAFDRSPSLRQRRRQESQGAGAGAGAVVPGTPTKAAATAATAAPSTPPKQQAVDEEARRLSAFNFFPDESGAANGGSRQQQPPPAQPVRRKESVGSVHTGTPQQPARMRRRPTVYKRIPRPDFSLPSGVTVTDLLQLLEAEFMSSDPQPALSDSPGSSFSPISSLSAPFTSSSPDLLSSDWSRPLPKQRNSTGSRPLRKHSSRLDMALDAERNVSGAEEIGLGMLEPRSVSFGGALGGCVPFTMEDALDRRLGRETTAPPVVMEGIFDVMENQ